MIAKLIIQGKEFDIDILDSELQKLIEPKKKTGYEYVGSGSTYSFVNNYGEIRTMDHIDSDDDNRYKDANYYSDYTVAENNARADKLMRQLRRFAALKRDNALDWNDSYTTKYDIGFDYLSNELRVVVTSRFKYFSGIYFHSESCAKAAIETFYDELIWYFTEYKDSL